MNGQACFDFSHVPDKELFNPDRGFWQGQDAERAAWFDEQKRRTEAKRLEQEKLEQELEYLKTVKRKEVVERIKIARSFGDLSENSEYDSAKEEQAFVEGRVTTLENMIRNAKIIEGEADTSQVSLGRTVTFTELPDGDEETYPSLPSSGPCVFNRHVHLSDPTSRRQHPSDSASCPPTLSWCSLRHR